LDKLFIILSKSDIFYLDDFVADVGKWGGSCVGKLVENLVDSDENWVDVFEQYTGVEVVVLAVQDQTDSKKIWMVPPSRVVRLGVRIIIGSGIGCIHIFREHLLSL